MLRPLLEGAHVAFADHRDIDGVLGGADAVTDASHEQRFATAAGRAFAAFPDLQRLACTVRTRISMDHHALGALMATRSGELHQIAPRELPGIVDRIGTGDAFVAGVLHGLMQGWSDVDRLQFAHAAGGLKHAIPGDFNLASAEDGMALVKGGRLDVRR